MKTNKNTQKTTTLPYRNGDRVWVSPVNGDFAHRLTLLLDPNKKLETDFYIFLYKSDKPDEDNLLIIKSGYLDNYFFTPDRKVMEQHLLSQGMDKYGEAFPFGTDLTQKFAVTNTSDTFVGLIVDLPQKETEVGILTEEQKERAAKHPKNAEKPEDQETSPTAQENNDAPADADQPKEGD